jgi:multidrug efflux pump subunit AcrB
MLLLSALILGLGIYGYIVIPKQDMPAIDTPYMAIQVLAPGVKASTIEATTVEDMEKVLWTSSDVMDIHTTVYDNVAVLYVLFRYDTKDPDALARSLFAKVNELELDETIESVSYDSGFDDPHVLFSVSSSTRSLTGLTDVATAFKNELLTINAIASVEVDSPVAEEVRITVDPALMSTYQLTLGDLYSLLVASTMNLPLGGIETALGLISVSGSYSYTDLEDFASLIVLPGIPGTMPEVQLGDIATIELTDRASTSYTFDGDQAVFLSIRFNEDIDFTALGDDVLAVKQEFLTTVGSDIQIEEMLFLPDYVNDQINTVFYSLLVAIGVVMLVVLIGIGFRNSLLVVLAVPLIVFGTIAILFLADQELHKLTIVGLIVAIGILVDNSIVVTESIKHHIDRGVPRMEAGKQAVRDTIGPILSSTLTTIAAFLVILLLPGFLGKIVFSMPLTVIIAIALSFLVSMTFSPVVAVLFLRPRKTPMEDNTIHHIRIRTMIQNTLRAPLAWIALSLASLAVVTYLAFRFQPIDLYPNDDRGILYIDFDNDRPGDLVSSMAIRDDISAVLAEQDAVEHIATSVGGSLPQFHFSAPRMSPLPQYGRVFVTLNMTESDVLEYKRELDDRLASIEGATITTHLIELSPPDPPLQVVLSGANIDSVVSAGNDLFLALEPLDEVAHASISTSSAGIRYQIVHDEDAIRNAYLTRAEVDAVIATTLNGYRFAGFTYNERMIDIHVRTPLATIEDLLTYTVHSDILDQAIPLSSLITIETVNDYQVITRSNNAFVATIDLHPARGTSLADMEASVQDVIDEHDLSGLTLRYGGENSLFEEISDDLIRAAVLALILIFLVLFIQFNNFLRPLIILLTIPLSFTGSFLFLLLFDVPITATGLIGMVSLMGVTVNTGILLVEYIRKNEATMGVKEACAEAVLQRFRPILLTSATTILGLVPLLVTGGNFFQPMALTFMGGMLTATMITIFLVPSVYTLFYGRKGPR